MPKKTFCAIIHLKRPFAKKFKDFFIFLESLSVEHVYQNKALQKNLASLKTGLGAKYIIAPTRSSAHFDV